MPSFYLTATSAEGQRATTKVMASTAAEARETLLERGWSEITIHTDDIMALYEMEAPGHSLSPDEMIRLGRMTNFQYFLFLSGKLYRQSPYLNLAAVLALGYGISKPALWSTVAGGVALAIPLFLAVAGAYGNTAKRQYDALLTAACWFRWDEAERLLRQQTATLPPLEVAYRQSQIVAGRGHIERALRSFSAQIRTAGIPEWFVCSRQADLYLTANRAAWAAMERSATSSTNGQTFVDAAINRLTEAVQKWPDQPANLIDLAKLQLKFKQDVVTARQLIYQAQQLVLTELPLLYVTYVNGLIDLEQNKPYDAISKLTEFARQLQRMAVNPVTDSALDEVRAFLTLAYAAANDTTNAMAQFRICEPRLIALHERELLTRCRNALGIC